MYLKGFIKRFFERIRKTNQFYDHEEMLMAFYFTYIL
jgi:hypothetical protein